jgi:hypothetical protein
VLSFFTIPAGAWNKLVDLVRRNRALQGPGVRLHRTPDGVVIFARPQDDAFEHPWQLAPVWNPAAGDQGAWTTTFRPGFVNGRDVTIATKDDKGDTINATLLDDPALELLSFRNPITSAGTVASADGELVFLAGEGYPAVFEKLGVVPAESESGDTADTPADPTRSRQIRAVDLVLDTPRASSSQRVDLLDPFADQQTFTISTTFDLSGLRRPRHSIFATGRWLPPQPPTALERLLGTAHDPDSDQVRLATLWLISPPGAAADAEPDGTWTPYPQHFVWWNLHHASKARIPLTQPPAPIQLRTGLAAGVADVLIASLLEPINDSAAQIDAYLHAADFTGEHWT